MREETYKDSAWLGWPVEWLDGRGRPGVKNPHITCLYFPNVTNLRKEDMIDYVKNVSFVREYKVLQIGDRKAFGPDKDIPVLGVWGTNSYYYLQRTNQVLKDVFRDSDYRADYTYSFDPHITVDLTTFIEPPQEILMRPLELWWRDDEPVPV